MVYDIGTQQSLEVIFSGVLIGGITRPGEGATEAEKAASQQVISAKSTTYFKHMSMFLREFQYNVFQDEYAFIYEILKTVGVRNFTSAQLDSLVETHRDLIMDSPYIDVSKYRTTVNGGASRDDEVIEAFRLDLQQKFVELSNRVVTDDEFKSAVKVFKDFYVRQKALEIAQNCTMILSQDGWYDQQTQHRKKLLRGIEDQREYYVREHKKIDDLMAGNGSTDIVIDHSWLRKEIEQEDSSGATFLTSFGLKAMDDAMGGLKLERMYGILGPTKGGKTRFANYLVARLLAAGVNVAVWPLEGQAEEWTAMQTAAILHMKWGINIPSNVIVDHRYNYAEDKGISAEYVRSKVITAKTMLALGSSDIETGERRGRLSFLRDTAYVEDFLDRIKNHHDEENPFQALVIDQVVNIQSRTSRQTKVERISDAYQKLHIFIQNELKCCVIAPAQLKQTTIDYIRSHPDETLDVTSGGESSETIRTPDEVIGLMSDKEQLKAGVMKFCHVASRHGAAFDDMAARAELGWVSFWDDPGLNEV